MKMDKRILDRLHDLFDEETEFIDQVLSYLNENCKEIHVGNFSMQASGFCDQNGEIFINQGLLKDGGPPRMFLPFLILHESVHMGHDWKSICELDYEDFKVKVNECEDEANSFALNFLGEIVTDELEWELETLNSIVENADATQKARFDEGYRPLYENIGGNLNFRDHVGEVV